MAEVGESGGNKNERVERILGSRDIHGKERRREDGECEEDMENDKSKMKIKQKK